MFLLVFYLHHIICVCVLVSTNYWPLLHLLNIFMIPFLLLAELYAVNDWWVHCKLNFSIKRECINWKAIFLNSTFLYGTSIKFWLIFFLFVLGDNEESNNLETSTWTDSNVWSIKCFQIIKILILFSYILIYILDDTIILVFWWNIMHSGGWFSTKVLYFATHLRRKYRCFKLLRNMYPLTQYLFWSVF